VHHLDFWCSLVTRLALVPAQARVFEKEEARQDSFVECWNKFAGSTRLGQEYTCLKPTKRSESQQGTGLNDGQMVVMASGKQYLLSVLEVKNEIGAAGDRSFQGLCYYQRYDEVCARTGLSEVGHVAYRAAAICCA
jgi:hypothetical protein